MFGFLVEHINLAFIDKVYTGADHVNIDDAALRLLAITLTKLIGQRSYDVGYHLVVCFESKLGVKEQNIKALLEVLTELLLGNFDLHVSRKQVVELVLGQEGIWTVLEVPDSIFLPVSDELSRNLSIWWQLSANFDNEVLHDLYHVVSIISR